MIGGAEISLGHLIAGLDPEIEATLLGVDAGVLAELGQRRPGVHRQLLPAVVGKLDLRSFGANLRTITRLAPDIFHANLAVPAAAQYPLTAATLVPGVQTVAVEQLPYPLHGRAQRALKQFTSRRLAAHIAVGEGAARLVEEFAQLPAGSIRVIHNGVPELATHPVARARPGPVLGTIGRLDHQKGFDVLIRALVDVPAATLVVVGDGPEGASLRTLAAELGVAGRVHFTGFSAEARRHLGGFDVFVLPSRFEGFPLVIVEAMLAGLPVVATDVGSVAEAVIDGQTGSLVPADDAPRLAGAIRALLEDPDRRSAMGAAARTHAAQFTAARMVTAYEQLYAQLLS
jgi:glycosyltransferase involved in cell wall biosynthesis